MKRPGRCACGGPVRSSSRSGTCSRSDKIDTGDTAWMIVATALVMLMTLPGLALFYGGITKGKNVLIH